MSHFERVIFFQKILAICKIYCKLYHHLFCGNCRIIYCFFYPLTKEGAFEMSSYKKVTLSTIGGGELEKDFDRALKKVVQDIEDLNKTDGNRRIEINISFSPDKPRTMANLTWSVKPVLAKMVEGQDIVFVSPSDDGGKTLTRHHDEQADFGFDNIDALTEKAEAVRGN